MPAREISTKIKLEGEKEFNSALRAAQRELRVMNSDLKSVAAEFEFTGDKQAMLTAKSRILRDEIAKQDKIVSDLAEMVEKSKKAYGEASAQTDSYRIKMSNATTTLFKLKQQLAETDREAEELGRDSTRVGRQIKDGIGDAAEDAGESLDDMIKKISTDVGGLKSSAAFSIATNIVSFVTGSIGNINDFVEGTRDYRNKRALAQSAAEEALNLTEEEYNNLFKRIVGITNDPDGATEGIITLMKSGVKTYQEALTLVDIMLGLYTQFGEEAKFEDVMESFQETYATGKMVGKFQELAERQGIDPEMVNKAMESATQEERFQILANAFAGKSGMQSLRDYREKNAPLIKENEAAAELENVKADLAEEAAPITTAVKEIVSDAFKTLTAGLQAGKGNTEEARKTLEDANSDSTHWLKRIFIPDESDWEEAGEDTSKAVQDFWGNLKEDLTKFGIPKHGGGGGKFFQDVKEAGDSTKEIWSADSTTEAPAEKGHADAEAYTEAVETTISDKIPTMKEITDAFLSGGEEGVQSLIDSRAISDEEKAELLTMLEMLGMTSGTKFDDALKKAMADATDNAGISGANIGTALKNGIDSTMPLAVASLQGYVGQMLAAYSSLNAGLNTRVVPPHLPGKPQTADYFTSSDRSVPVILEMNGREIGRGILPTINTMQGRNLVRAAIT